MVREETIQKMNRIKKLMEKDDELSIRAACERVGLSETWFYKIRKQLREKNELNGRTRPTG